MVFCMKYIFLDLEMNTIAKEHKELRQICRQEVIEFGAVCLDEDYREIGEFQCYVKPELNDGIAQHITKITGITTDQVMNADTFQTAFESFISWCGTDYEIYSWSDSDSEQLQKEMEIKGICPTRRTREMFGSWNDLQARFDKLLFCERQISLSMALSNAGIDFKGRAHSALTDARATADLYREMNIGNTLKRLRKSMETSRKPLSANLGDLISASFVFA